MIHEYDLGGRDMDYRSKNFIDEVITLYKAGRVTYTPRTQGDHVVLLEDTTFSNFAHYRLFIAANGEGELWGRRKSNPEATGIFVDDAKNNPYFLLESLIRDDELLLSRIDAKTPHRLLVGAKNIKGEPRLVVWRSFIYTPDQEAYSDANAAFTPLAARRIQ